MISKERAAALVEAHLAVERLSWQRPLLELAVCRVEEHAVGWVVFWNSAEFARTRDIRHSLVGSGPYLVDRYDGSIHHIPTFTWSSEDWEELYLRQVKGVSTPGPLTDWVRELVGSAGSVSAMRHLRRRAPRLSLRQARDYVAAVRDGVEPPEDLVDLTREVRDPPVEAIQTLAGPVQ